MNNNSECKVLGNLERVIDLFERVINLLRPQAYNTIARLVVGTGLLLLVESQVNFVHALIVALYETYIERSELLRNVLNASSEPTIGITLVLAGLAYHVIVTVVKDYVEVTKSKLPKHPSLSCLFLESDGKEISEDEYQLRGCLVSLPEKSCIPDYKKCNPEFEHDQIGALMASMQPIGFRKTINEHLYRQRASVLDKWAGAELFHLRISNTGSVMANGVSILLQIPRSRGVTIKETRMRIPDLPKEETKEEYSFLLHGTQHIEKMYDDLSVHSDNKFHNVSWSVNSMQANTEQLANNYLLIKATERVSIKGTIFCDEFTEPQEFSLTLLPASKTREVTLDALKNEDTFRNLVNECIMDEYPKRECDRLIRKYELDREIG